MGYFRPDIEALTGYVPGEQPRGGRVIKLNTNENPYPPSPAAVAAGQAELERARLYSDPVALELREAAAEAYGLTADQVLAGNGSDDCLNLLIRATTAPGEVVASFCPSYSLYSTLAGIQGAAYREIPFTDDYRVPEGLDLDGVRVLFLPNPNAPSGTVVSHAVIRRLAAACPGLVVIDEAYVDFADENALPLLADQPNLVITRTFSKSYSLAGLRIGLALAAPAIIAQLMKVKDSYNLDRVAIAAGAAALRDQATLAENTRRIRATRDRLQRELTDLGAGVLPSQTNFVLARFGAPQAENLYRRLKERRILVRWFDASQLADSLRITVGTDEEVDALLAALRELLAREAPSGP